MTKMLLNDGAFADHYTLLDPIGHPGSFGVVHQAAARDDPTVRYAVKIMDRVQVVRTNHDRIRQRLLDMEVQLNRTIEHPFIVRVQDVIVTESQAFIVMEECVGGDLFDRIMAYGGRVPETDARGLFVQMCAALLHLHSRNVVHGDVKLSNIMFANQSDDSLRLIDFGMAQAVAKGQLLHDTVGTPNYQSPDIINGCYSFGTDAWSAGVVLYVLIFGFNPFDPFGSTNDHTVIHRRVLNGFIPVTAHGYGPFFPDSVAASLHVKNLITGLLTSNPLERMSVEDALSHPWMQMKKPKVVLSAPAA